MTVAPIIKPRAPYDTAETFCRRRAGKADQALIRYRGTWYKWNGVNYRKLDAEAVRAELWEFLASGKVEVKDPESGETTKRKFRPEPRDVTNLYDALMARGEVRVSEAVHAPEWLPGASIVSGCRTHRAGDLLACPNGLADLITGELLPHSPFFLTMNAVDYDYDPAATCPRFDKFLDEIFPGSVAERPDDFDEWSDERKDVQQRRELVLEIFGYLLSGDTRQQKLFLFMGKSRSGKGTLARVLRRLIGETNVTGYELKSLDRDFGAEDLIDKQVAIVGDARLDGKSHDAVSRLLSFSGEDEVIINRKNEKKWKGTLRVNFLILTNPLLNFTDASGVIATRFIPVRFGESFLGKENTGLTDELLTELPGILNRAVEGLRRLRERGHFELAPSSAEILAGIARKATPILNFIEDECEVGEGHEIGRDRLFGHYKAWCDDSGYRHSSRDKFVAALEDADPNIKCIRPRAEDGSRPRIVQGIRLRQKGRAALDGKVVPLNSAA
jgi:putative DNA primase/helicase